MEQVSLIDMIFESLLNILHRYSKNISSLASFLMSKR